MWKVAQDKLRRQLRYERVATASADDADERSYSSDLTLPIIEDDAPIEGKRKWRALISFAFSSLCLFTSVSFFLYRLRHQVTDERCMRRMSAPSPALEAVKYEWLTFADSFQPDVYSGYPSAASEKAWGKLWDFGAFSVPAESLSGLNKSSSTGDFRVVDSHGTGVGGLLEGAHQIHCLNLVRQFIYRDHWDYSQLPSFSGGDKTRRHHVDHCIATLRTVFTCLSDVTPYVLVKSAVDGKAEGRGLPHKCRVYKDMVNWVNDHSVFDSIE
ncbi:sorting nexin-41 [Purpureocillium lavendulum]|uniref:Sorting nexin-41 n=1 Tax=Purpureocillium lavendulum TaxID=1247861 RepID=A0AB34FEX4_9HYPO|nr:sorting nexin-41 [Purpureocillium lavendulum]